MAESMATLARSLAQHALAQRRDINILQGLALCAPGRFHAGAVRRRDEAEACMEQRRPLGVRRRLNRARGHRRPPRRALPGLHHALHTASTGVGRQLPVQVVRQG